MSAQTEFEARLEKWRANGLVDIKFFVNHQEKMTMDDLFAALNEFHDAIDGGNFETVETVETIEMRHSELLQA